MAGSQTTNTAESSTPSSVYVGVASEFNQDIFRLICEILGRGGIPLRSLRQRADAS